MAPVVLTYTAVINEAVMEAVYTAAMAVMAVMAVFMVWVVCMAVMADCMAFRWLVADGRSLWFRI